MLSFLLDKQTEKSLNLAEIYLLLTTYFTHRWSFIGRFSDPYSDL